MPKILDLIGHLEENIGETCRRCGRAIKEGQYSCACGAIDYYGIKRVVKRGYFP